jgi:hypothetical protein
MNYSPHHSNRLFGTADTSQAQVARVAAGAGIRFPGQREVVLGGTVLPTNRAADSKGAAAETLPQPAATKKDSTPTERPWQGVFFDGPQSDQDQEGDEIPVWVVYVGDEQAEPVGKVYECHSFPSAEALARRMARDRNLELIHEAMPA